MTPLASEYFKSSLTMHVATSIVDMKNVVRAGPTNVYLQNRDERHFCNKVITDTDIAASQLVSWWLWFLLQYRNQFQRSKVTVHTYTLGCLRTQFRCTDRAAGGYSSGYGYQKYPRKISAPSRARSASDNSLKIYLYRYTNKTSDFEANFEKVYFQSTQKGKSLICYPYGPMYFPGKV